MSDVSIPYVGGPYDNDDDLSVPPVVAVAIVDPPDDDDWSYRDTRSDRPP